uniref:Uncharacterized protein n=1 Tax=Nymphaea colorata TaxID=210225 RepID=A0A5K0XUM8_9MAGN
MILLYYTQELEGLQWIIHKVEMDLKRSSDHPAMQLYLAC